MKSNKKFIVYLIILVILLISFVLILLGRSGLLFKIKGNIGNLINTTNLEVSFKTEDNNVIVDYKNNSPLEYQIVESDFYTVNNVRLILKNRDRFLNAFDNYINIYSNNQNNEEIDYKTLIDNFNNGKTNTIIESNEKINNVLNDLSLSDSWITINNNIINVENDNKDRVIIVRDLNNNYYVYYSLNSKEIVDFEQCEINEEYLQYLSLSSEEKKNIEIIPEVCIETKTENRMLRKSSVDSGTYPAKYPANFGTDEFFNSTHMRIKTQMNTPFCVMFSTMATLENYLYTKYHQHYTFSEEYAALKMTRLFVDSSTGVKPVTNPIGYRHDMEHGFSNWSAAKFIAYYGPIYDDELAWRNSTGKARINILDDRVGKVDVNEVRVTNSMSIDEIKENITTYGANKFGALITREDFKNKYYHYNDSNYSSHAITAIGWDDNVSKNLFGAPYDGAFIIKNSYGDYDYNSLNGYFYLSYYQFRRNYLAIQDADFDFNDNEYFYDYGGPVESLLTKYQAIKVTKKNSREVLKRIKYSVFSDATVSIYFIPDGNSTLSINNATLLMDNKTVKAGIHTYDLETPIELTNDTFYIIIKTSDYSKLAFQHFSEQSNVVRPPENISFSSTNGSTFTDSTTDGYTSMIAAYTDNIESSDTTNPTAQLHFSSERDDPNPTLLLQCRDNKGATGYYFGTSSPNSSNMTNTDNINKINNEGIIFENVKEGTYYLGCKDAAGNTDVASININKYVVNNYYEKLESTSTDPDPSNYDLISSYTLYVKNGSKIFPEEIYKVTGQFIGYTKTTGSSTSELTGNKIEVNDNDSVYNMYFNRDKKTYTISVSGLNGKVKAETIYQPNNEITVTISNTYVSGASGEITAKEGDYLKLTAIPVSGYDLNTWGSSIGSASPLYLKVRKEGISSITAEFSNSVQKVNVTYKNNGTTYGEVQTVTAGTKASRPMDPTNGNKKFLYWSTTDGGSEYDFNSLVARDMTLYAVYEEPILNTVTFDSKGGSEVASQSVESGGKATKPSDPTKKGNTFKHWSTSENGTAYDFNTAITGNLTLYAVWQTNTYTVTFNTHGGSAVQSQTISYGGKVTQPANPTKENYTFKHWSTSENGTAYSFNTAVTDDMTLHAVYEKTKYNVKFISDGTIVREGQLEVGSIITPPAPPEKQGYTFVCWSETENGTAYDFNVQLNKALTLYAVYTQNPVYTVTFNPNEGTVSETTRQINSGSKIGVLPVPTRNEYTFEGWYINLSDASPVNKNLVVTSNITLIAKWTKIPDVEIIDNNNAIKNENTFIITIPTGIKLTRSKVEEMISIPSNFTIKDKSNNEITASNQGVGTNSKIVSNNKTYDIVVRGDINGDGELSIIDLINIYGYMNEIDKGTPTKLNQNQIIACDFKGDSRVDILDLINVYNRMKSND